jgi:His/Glu/Gln/Arg/opine family amino acid ABC transporter permease subunit
VTFDWWVLWDYRWQLLAGVGVAVLLTVLTMAGALVLGMPLALARMSAAAPLRWLAAGYIELFRSTPLILQIYWVFYVLPYLTGVALPAFETALVGLVLNVSAFNAETFRSGITSIRCGQWHAAQALGMTPLQVLRVAILPQAVRRVLPALATTWVSLFKDTSLVAVIAVADLSYVALQLRAQTYRVLEVLTGMAAIYWLLGYPQAKLADWIHRRYRTAE